MGFLNFTAPKDGKVQLNCVFGAFGTATGTARFDNVLELVGFNLANEAVEVAAGIPAGRIENGSPPFSPRLPQSSWRWSVNEGPALLPPQSGKYPLPWNRDRHSI